MKTAFITLVALLHINAAYADTYVCKEIKKPGTMGGASISVTVTETAKLSNILGGKTFDAVHKVNVVVSSKVLGAPAHVLKNFNAISTTEDVDYLISSVRANGVKIAIFLDEADDGWMEISDQSGNKRNVSMSCELANPARI